MTEFALSCYNEIMAADDYMSVGESILIPRFDAKQMDLIITKTCMTLSQGSPLVRKNGDFIVVGDIHGSFHDLLRIFSTYGYPPATNYIFLGDYVDRGEFSVEVITLLFVLYCSYPDNVTLIRGNHEFNNINAVYGFKDECISIFGDEKMYNSFNQAFEYLPLACIINDKLFAVHGGISSRLDSVSDIENLKFPISVGNDMVSDLVWSDPTDKRILYCCNPRGVGCLFGENAVRAFLSKMDLQVLVRAHQCVDGYEIVHGNKTITVFSSSNYTTSQNSSGALSLTSDSGFIPVKFPPLQKKKRNECNYNNVVEGNNDDLCNMLDLKSAGRVKSICHLAGMSSSRKSSSLAPLKKIPSYYSINQKSRKRKNYYK